MHRCWRSTAREVVSNRVDRCPDLTMFEEKKRYTGSENERPDVDVSHGSKRISSSSLMKSRKESCLQRGSHGFSAWRKRSEGGRIIATLSRLG